MWSRRYRHSLSVTSGHFRFLIFSNHPWPEVGGSAPGPARRPPSPGISAGRVGVQGHGSGGGADPTGTVGRRVGTGSFPVDVLRENGSGVQRDVLDIRKTSTERRHRSRRILPPGSSTAASRRSSVRGMVGCRTGARTRSRHVAVQTARRVSRTATADPATALNGYQARTQSRQDLPAGRTRITQRRDGVERHVVDACATRDEAVVRRGWFDFGHVRLPEAWRVRAPVVRPNSVRVAAMASSDGSSRGTSRSDCFRKISGLCAAVDLSFEAAPRILLYLIVYIGR